MITQKIKGTKYHAIKIGGIEVAKAWVDKDQLKIKADGRKTVTTSAASIEALTELHVHFAFSELEQKPVKIQPKKAEAKKTSKKKSAKKTKKASKKPEGRRIPKTTEVHAAA